MHLEPFATRLLFDIFFQQEKKLRCRRKIDKLLVDCRITESVGVKIKKLLCSSCSTKHLPVRHATFCCFSLSFSPGYVADVVAVRTGGSIAGRQCYKLTQRGWCILPHTVSETLSCPILLLQVAASVLVIEIGARSPGLPKCRVKNIC